MYESEFKNVKNGVMVYAAMPVSQHDAFLEKYREVIREEAENPDLRFRLTAAVDNDNWNLPILDYSAPSCVESFAFIFVFEGAGDITAQDLEEHKWFSFPNYKLLRDCCPTQTAPRGSYTASPAMHLRFVTREERIGWDELKTVKNGILITGAMYESDFEKLLAEYRGIIKETAGEDLKYHLADVREVCDEKPEYISHLQNFSLALIFEGPGIMDYADLKEQKWFDCESYSYSSGCRFTWLNEYLLQPEFFEKELSEDLIFNHLSAEKLQAAVRDFENCNAGGGFDSDISSLSWYLSPDEEVGVYPCRGAEFYLVKVAHRVLPPGYERPKSNWAVMTSDKAMEIRSRPLDPDKPAAVFVIGGKKHQRFNYGCAAIVWSNKAFQEAPFQKKLALIRYGADEVRSFWNRPD